ncbi:hypothetical protein ncot_11580 [Nocardioides sp. JQ2195]|uniref:hypothetical protein n=1 Tax=Nocardioides sp. JQ2195 TaxID=2592334 RepID=UPI00143E4061|nr:hypothetical protein [Nocardioides sp. JQ2195]QIX27168.1 hypothetical protein ncot_11580 [Nocardioides sp. JQ2195]
MRMHLMALAERPARAIARGRIADLLRQRPWQVVLAMAALACVLGWLPFLGRPLSPDESGLLMVARQWGPGDSLYGDYWVDRPPVLIALVAVGNLMGGASGLRLLGMVAVFASVSLAGLLGRTVAPRTRTAPVLPAAVAALLLATPLFGGTVVNAELLGLPLLLGGMIAAIRSVRSTSMQPSSERTALRWGMVAGAAGAAAVLTKQNLLDVFVLLLALLVAGVIRSGRSGDAAAGTSDSASHGSLGLRGRGTTALGAALGAGSVLTVVVIGSAALGTGPVDLWSAVVQFRWEASTVATESPATGHRFGLMLWALVGSGAPLLLVVLLRRARQAAFGEPSRHLLAPALAVVGWEAVAVVAGGSYWLHYLTGLLPGLVLLAAVSGLPQRLRGSVPVAVGLIAVSTLCSIGWVLVHPIDRPEQEVASFLAARAQPGDTAVVAFGVASILESSGLESPYPHLWSLPVRVRDSRLHELATVMAGPDRPTWLVISGRGLGTWGIDTTAAQRYIGLYYARVADVAGYRIFREDVPR